MKMRAAFAIPNDVSRMSVNPDHVRRAALDSRAPIHDEVRCGRRILGWQHLARTSLRIVDLEGNQAVDTLFYNAHESDEHYSAVDTIRGQGNIYLTTGTKLRSNLGANAAHHYRGYLWVGTTRSAVRVRRRAIPCATRSKRGHMHSCRDSFLLALARRGHDLGKRDLPSNINFFMNVPVTSDGKLSFADGLSCTGALR